MVLQSLILQLNVHPSNVNSNFKPGFRQTGCYLDKNGGLFSFSSYLVIKNIIFFFIKTSKKFISFRFPESFNFNNGKKPEIKWGAVAEEFNLMMGKSSKKTSKHCHERWINHLNPLMNRLFKN